MTERSIRITDESYKKIKKIAKAENRTLKTIISLSVENYSKKSKKEWRV